jgi:hypothetical protein
MRHVVVPRCVVQGSVLSIKLRFSLLRMLNVRLARVVPLVDIMNASDVYSLGFKLRWLNHCVLIDTKSHVLQCAVDHTWSGHQSGMAVSLDNKLALASIERASRDAGAANIATSTCLFAQVFKSLSHHPPKLFRCPYDDRGTLFKVSFVDEPGIDAGGLFRDTMSAYVDVCCW